MQLLRRKCRPTTETRRHGGSTEFSPWHLRASVSPRLIDHSNLEPYTVLNGRLAKLHEQRHREAAQRVGDGELFSRVQRFIGEQIAPRRRRVLRQFDRRVAPDLAKR